MSQRRAIKITVFNNVLLSSKGNRNISRNFNSGDLIKGVGEVHVRTKREQFSSQPENSEKRFHGPGSELLRRSVVFSC